MGKDAETALCVETGLAKRQFAGEPCCGDAALVRSLGEGTLLVVVDGLGHGPEAASASDQALHTLAHCDRPELSSLFSEVHAALRGSRGAVMSLAFLEERSGLLRWGGVGNVEGVVFFAQAGPGRKRDYIPWRPGILGQRQPSAWAESSLRLRPRDIIVLATDGIQEAFCESVLNRDLAAPLLAERILADFGRTSDDALVLVAKIVAKAPERA